MTIHSLRATTSLVHKTPYVASLRIYEPLSAFEPADRLRWQEIDASVNSKIAEEEFALRRLVFPEPPTGRPDGAHVLDIDGQRFVSPWSTATRCWAALDNFKDSYPASVVPFFISPALEDGFPSFIRRSELAARMKTVFSVSTEQRLQMQRHELRSLIKPSLTHLVKVLLKPRLNIYLIGWNSLTMVRWSSLITVD